MNNLFASPASSTRFPSLAACAAIAALSLTACGGSVVQGQGGSGTGAGSSSTGASNGTGGATSGGCPATIPSGSCAGEPEGLRCTYGSSTRADCREVATCVQGAWETPGTACVTPPASVCGTSEPAAATTCNTMGDTCTYGSSVCFCGCSGGVACLPPVTWECWGPPMMTGCPATVPNDGTACSSEPLECTYGGPCTAAGAVVDCIAGHWKWNLMIACAG